MYNLCFRCRYYLSLSSLKLKLRGPPRPPLQGRANSRHISLSSDVGCEASCCSDILSLDIAAIPEIACACGVCISEANPETVDVRSHPPRTSFPKSQYLGTHNNAEFREKMAFFLSLLSFSSSFDLDFSVTVNYCSDRLGFQLGPEKPFRICRPFVVACKS